MLNDHPTRGESRLGKEISYSKLMKIQTGDVVISNIAAALGSTSVVTPDLADLLVSSEYTVLRIKDSRFDPLFVWGYLRSSEVRARLLSEATGISRHRVKWDELEKIPIPVLKKRQNKIIENYKKFFEMTKIAVESSEEGNSLLNNALNTDNEWAVKRLKAAKPPK